MLCEACFRQQEQEQKTTWMLSNHRLPVTSVSQPPQEATVPHHADLHGAVDSLWIKKLQIAIAKIHERGDVWGRHGVAYSRLIIAYLDPAGWSVCELHQDHK